MLRSGNPLDNSAASQIAEFLADLSSLSWNLQDLFGFGKLIPLLPLTPNLLFASDEQNWKTFVIITYHNTH
jgi:hypothetical protein